jgi:hypothetical protein
LNAVSSKNRADHQIVAGKHMATLAGLHSFPVGRYEIFYSHDEKCHRIISVLH